MIIKSAQHWETESKDSIQKYVIKKSKKKSRVITFGSLIECRYKVYSFSNGERSGLLLDSQNVVETVKMKIDVGSGLPGLEEVLKGHRAGDHIGIIFPAHMKLGENIFKGLKPTDAAQAEIEILKVLPRPKVNLAYPTIKFDDPRWITRKSGVKILHIKKGMGKPMKYGKRMSIGWIGWVENGRCFDRSDSGMLLNFNKGSAIAGWEEGIQLMKEGGEAYIFVPSELAYGKYGYKPLGVPPHANLLFHVILKTVK